jgi:hypothetical protein
MNFTNDEVCKLFQSKIVKQFVFHIFDNNLIKTNKHCREFFRQFLLVHYPKYKSQVYHEDVYHEYMYRIDNSVILYARSVYGINACKHVTMYEMIRQFTCIYDKSYHTLNLFDKFTQLATEYSNAKNINVSDNSHLQEREYNNVPLNLYSYDENAHNEFLTENNAKRFISFLFRTKYDDVTDMHKMFFVFLDNYVSHGLWQNNIYSAYCNYIKMMRFHHARKILKQYNPYVIFCNKFIITRKNMYVWFCEQTYDTFKNVNYGEKCCVDEVIMCCVHGFL